jgi:hypothetical protein
MSADAGGYRDREEADRERGELRRRLERGQEPRESPETPPVESPEGEEVWLDASSPQESTRRSWWRRVFGR